MTQAESEAGPTVKGFPVWSADKGSGEGAEALRMQLLLSSTKIL